VITKENNEQLEIEKEMLLELNKKVQIEAITNFEALTKTRKTQQLFDKNDAKRTEDHVK